MNSSKDWFYTHPSLPTPKSETHEFLQNGLHLNVNCRKLVRRQLNFSAYKTTVSRQPEDDFDRKDLENFLTTTSYRRDYYAPYAPKCAPISSIIDDPDPLFNRRPVNAFQMLPWAPGKFMDDHFSHPSEQRKKINFFRQIRQTSYFEKP